MNYLYDIASLIQIRNFLQSSLDNLQISISTSQRNEIVKKITVFDQLIINKSLSLNIDRTRLTDKETTEYNFTSSEDTAEIISKFDMPLDPKKIKKVRVDESSK